MLLLPMVAIPVGIIITATINTVQIMVAVSWLEDMVVAVGCGLQIWLHIPFRILCHQFAVHISHGMNVFPVPLNPYAIAIGVVRSIGYQVNHRVFMPVYMIGTIHIESVGRLLPQGEQALVVDGTYLVYLPITAVGLYPARILVRDKKPLEMSAYAVGSLLRQLGFQLEQFAKPVFTVLHIAMQSQCTPRSILAVQ